MRFKDLFEEVMKVPELSNTLNPEEIELGNKDFSIDDIYEVIGELNADELNEVGEFILNLIYDPEFDEDEDEVVEDLEDLEERQYFKNRNSQLKRSKKLNVSDRKKAAKLRKKYYKKHKSKLKRSNKLYRKKVKRNPNIQKKHRN